MIAANSIIGGRYRVTRALGGGGMKLVYLAEDLRLAARLCALAEMVDSFNDPKLQQQAAAAFQREADMLAQLSNEHIPRIYDRFSEKNRHYLVMEFVDGKTLEDELREAGGKLPQKRVTDIALQILDTLEYLHNLSPPVIYRDLKPSNVMLTRSGQVKLVDFGIARFFQPQSSVTMIGTQGYAPPEQYRGQAQARSDLYALGATMHQALSGRDPAAEAPFSFPPLRSLCPGVTPGLAELVDQALQYDPIHRMADAAEFKQRLLGVTTGAPRPAANGVDRSAAAASGRPQLKLPLGGPYPQPSPEAATVVISASETRCGACSRSIPADSRFCSFCGATIMHQTAQGASGNESETVVLSQGRSSFSRASVEEAAAERSPARDLRPLRFVVALFAGLLILSFVAAGVISYLKQAPVAPEPEAMPRYAPPGSEAEPEHRSARAIALRRTLDLAGYNNVHFRIDGDTAILWGTVPNELDRMEIQAMAFAAGIYSLEDHITVRGSPFGLNP